jgi:acyl dehydratase
MVAAVVLTVKVAVCADAPVIVTDTGTLHVAGSLEAVGVIAQVRLIAPVKPPAGVRVMVEVLAVVAPGGTVTAVVSFRQACVTAFIRP